MIKEGGSTCFLGASVVLVFFLAMFNNHVAMAAGGGSSLHLGTIKRITIHCPLTVDEGGVIRCSAKAFYSKGAIRKVTNEVLWEVKSKYATINQNGTVSALEVESNQLMVVSVALNEKNITAKRNTFVTIRNIR